MKAAFYYIPLSGRVNEDQEENFRENKIKFLADRAGQDAETIAVAGILTHLI